MSNYGLFFSDDKKVYRLPVNPESIEISSSMSTETYEILGGSQIVVPTHMELREITFECEFPSELYMYVENQKKFKKCEYYESLFTKWRDNLKPVRFTLHNGKGSDISMMCLITKLTITETAGEEGDKVFAFTLNEYKEYTAKEVVETKNKKKTKKTNSSNKTNPNNKGTYTVVSGDSLWKISKKYYGDGTKWTKIYNANKDKIKNPNLIYPKQVLTIPN